MAKAKRTCGIYKITNPNGKVYIGQSVWIERRFWAYKKRNAPKQYKLDKSFKKYGVENHIFEMIEECLVELLNERERHYQDFFECITREKGLNCVLTQTVDRSGFMCDETRKKISKGNKGKPSWSKGLKNCFHGEALKIMREVNIGRKQTPEHIERSAAKRRGPLHCNWGKSPSAEIRKKQSESTKGEKAWMWGRKRTPETMEKWLKANSGEKAYWYGKKLPKEIREKMSKSMKGNNNGGKPVLNTETGIYYDSAIEAYRYSALPFGSRQFTHILKGISKTNIPFIYA